MTRELIDEDEAAQDIIDRLATRFPHVPAQRIVDAVNEARHHFERARVRDFVPVLIEREARARLENPI